MSAAAADAGDDLEALFDQVAAETAAKVAVVPQPAANEPEAQTEASQAEEGPQDMYQRLGHLTRTLHDALRELGYDRSIEGAVQSLPDARDRLSYIAKLTGKAAERALSAVERGQSVQTAIGAHGEALSARWERLYAGELSVDEFKVLAGETRDYLKGVPAQSREVGAQLHEIMMAQDFHDLTGQVIGKMVTMAQQLEQKLLQLLVESKPGSTPASEQSEWLGGPAINAEGRSDVVSDQAQVDALLGSLGF